MASSDNIRNAITEHISRDIELCDTQGLTCRDCVCGVCAGQCILGLMWQLSNPSGNVDKASSGGCGRSLYVPACYPCVVTDGCCVYAAVDTLQSSAPNDRGAELLSTVVTTGARLRVRDKLKARAGDTSGGVSESLLQICCPVCFCTPCHNAALIRKLRPPGYGSLWCPPPTTVARYAML